MTAQASDQVNYRRDGYSLAGKNGSGLFSPAVHDLKPARFFSACWRGYTCTYAVQDGKFHLDALSLHLNEPAPPLFGVTPELREHGTRMFTAVYNGLAHPVPYSGGMLLGADFVEELYIHMGFHPAWKYREVHELVFRDGELLQEADRSEQIAEFRRKFAERPRGPGSDAKQPEIRHWIEQCFSQRYSW